MGVPDPSNIDSGISTGWLALGGVGVPGLVWAFFQIKKLLRNDKGEERQAEREHSYLSNLEERIKELEARADKFAEERNVALQEAARLSGQVQVLETKLAHVEQEKGAIRTLLTDVENKYRALSTENERMRAEIAAMEKLLVTARPEMAVKLGVVDEKHT
jgi:chromosome segregation ATPase